MKLAGVVSDTSDFALSREQLKLLGIIFVVLGLLEFGGSYLILGSITQRQAEAAQAAVDQANDCKGRLSGLGYTVTLNGDTLTAEMPGLDDAAYKLGQASIAFLSCQGWAPSRFCMGEGCGPKGGEQFELKPVKSPD